MSFVNKHTDTSYYVSLLGMYDNEYMHDHINIEGSSRRQQVVKEAVTAF